VQIDLTFSKNSYLLLFILNLAVRNNDHVCYACFPPSPQESREKIENGYRGMGKEKKRETERGREREKKREIKR
jgi:hypothetical protein